MDQKEARKLWVEALRSGKFTQIEGRLGREIGTNTETTAALLHPVVGPDLSPEPSLDLRELA